MSGLLRALLFLLVLGFILYSGLRPVAPETTLSLTVHAVAFAALAGSGRWLFSQAHAFWTLLYGLIFALVVELARGLLPEGEVSVAAIAADLLGVVVGLVLAQVLKQLRHKRQVRQGW
ncbi:MAG: VanZ family protein [Pseudomonas sp.]